MSKRKVTPLNFAYLGEDGGSPTRDGIVTAMTSYGILIFEEEEVDLFSNALNETEETIDVFIINESDFKDKASQEELRKLIPELSFRFPDSRLFIIVNEHNLSEYETLMADEQHSNIIVHKLSEIGKFKNRKQTGVQIGTMFNYTPEEVEKIFTIHAPKIAEKEAKNKETNKTDINIRYKKEKYSNINSKEVKENNKQEANEKEMQMDSKEAEIPTKKEKSPMDEVSAIVNVKYPQSISNSDLIRLLLVDEGQKQEMLERGEEILHISSIFPIQILPEAEKKQIKIKVKKRVEKHLPIFTNPLSQISFLQNKRIAIANLLPGSGSTFVTHNLAIAIAKHFSNSPVVLEGLNQYPVLFKKLRKTKPRAWHCWYDLIRKGKEIHKNKLWETYGVHWIPQHPTSLIDLNEKDSQGYMYEHALEVYQLASSLSLLLVDLSSNITGGISRDLIFEDVDEVWLVMNFNPDKIEYAKSHLDLIKERVSENTEIHYILNMKPENQKTYASIEHFIEQKLLTVIPLIPDYMGNSEEEVPFPYLEDEGEYRLSAPFEPLLQRVIKKEAFKQFKKEQKEIIKHQKKKSSFLFQNILNFQ